jgi:hypothetical protein
MATSLPYPVTYASPAPERIADPNAAVTIVNPRSRLVTATNVLTNADWAGWLDERAIDVPRNWIQATRRCSSCTTKISQPIGIRS